MNPFAEAVDLLVAGDVYLWSVVARSLAISGSALVLAVVVGLPVGAAVALSRLRRRPTVVALLHTGLALPPVVVGLGVYLMLSRAGPLGGLDLLYSPAAVVLAQVVIAGPYVAAIAMGAVAGVPGDVRVQARALGASRLQALWLHLRECRASLLAAVAAAFGSIISEVGAVLIVGGNVLGETRVMTSTIVLETRRGNFGVAVGLGGVLLLVAFGVNLALTLLERGTFRRPWLA